MIHMKNVMNGRKFHNPLLKILITHRHYLKCFGLCLVVIWRKGESKSWWILTDRELLFIKVSVRCYTFKPIFVCRTRRISKIRWRFMLIIFKVSWTVLRLEVKLEQKFSSQNCYISIESWVNCLSKTIS